MYHSIIKPLMFSIDAEKAHHSTVKLMKSALSLPFGKSIFKKMYDFQDARLEKDVFGLHFKNPVGLAAGFDKDGKYFKEMSNVGFGFLEIGTVTPLPQGGNPQPRLFRLKEDRALINRMGFNNDGVDALVKRLKGVNLPNTILGANIGKNKVTPNENAIDDYVICFTKLFDLVDYFVVNVSSPNTPGLRDLQDKEPLTKILNKLMEINNSKSNPKPILLKIAPDLTDSQLDDIVEIVKVTDIAGVIATNTTIARDKLNASEAELDAIGNGGLSGNPLKERSTEVIKYLFEKSNQTMKIVGVGGIESGQDAMDKINAGACLVQVYSGMIYKGPGLVKEINKYILKSL